jgi:GT2 family glycosyltransferase
MSIPRLSVCIVSWNTRQLLSDCLETLYADPQAVDWEVIVVDNGSQDGSPEAVRRDFPQVDLVESGENLGFSGGNNLALARAQAPYLLLLNPDTLVETGALGQLVDFVEARPEIGVAGPMLLNADQSLQLSCGIAPSLQTETIHKLLLHKVFPMFKLGRWDHRQIRPVGWVSGACILVRRSAVAAVGPLDSGFYMYHEDVEWCLRFNRGGWGVYYYPFSRVVHLGGQSTRQDFSRMLVVSQQSLFHLFKKHFGRGRLQALRVLTLVEMGLRTLIWGVLALAPARREEGRQRLRAYGEIARRTLGERAYWSPPDEADAQTNDG